MKNRKIQVSVKQLETFIGDVAAVPCEPVGEHLSDDEAIGYVMEMLMAEEVQRVDTHLVSCPECTETVDALYAAHEQWEARGITIQMRGLHVIATLTFTAHHLSRTRRLATRFGTAESLFQDWMTEQGVACNLSENERGFVFSVDTTDEARNAALVRFALTDAKTGEEPVVGLLVLHPDPFNEGHYVASARLDDDVALPENCQPRLDFVELESAQSPVGEVLLNAVSSAYEDADRRAWRDWAKREETAGRLSKELVEAIWQLIGDDA